MTISLSGTVKDPKGGNVPGATVTTKDDGAYIVGRATVGSYAIRVKTKGFNKYVQRCVRFEVG